MTDEWQHGKGPVKQREVTCPSDRTAIWLLRKLEGYSLEFDDHDVVICVWQELVELRAKLKHLGVTQSQSSGLVRETSKSEVPG